MSTEPLLRRDPVEAVRAALGGWGDRHFRDEAEALMRALAAQGYEVKPKETAMHSDTSTLATVIQAYMEAKGFHPTGDTGLWGHPQLGEGRQYWDCVQWQIGREMTGNA